MATLPYFQNAGRPNVTLEDLLRMTALYGSDPTPGLTGESTQFTRQANPYGYGQQTDAGTIAMYDPQGQYLGDDKPERMNALDKVIAAIVMAGGGAVAGNALGLIGGGGGGLGEAALGGAGDAAGGFAGGAGAEAAPAAFDFSSIGLGDGGLGALTGGPMTTASAGGGGASFTDLLGNYSNEGRNYPTPASTQGAGGSPLNASMASQGLGALGNMGTLGRIAGGLLGAYEARNQQQSGSQTSTREPWAEAKPFLTSLLNQGQQLQQQYSAQPFSQQQQTAYNNLGGLLNTVNSQAPNLAAGFMANASGANNYDRSNPRKALTGSSFDMSSFMPQALQFFGR